MGGLADLGLNVLGGHLTLAGPLSFGLAVFFLIGAGGALLRRGYDRTRAWAQGHPWTYAATPALATLATVFATYLLFSAQGVFGSLWEGVSDGLGVLVLLGVVGYVSRGVRPAGRR